MKRPVILVAAVAFAVLYLLPKLAIEKLKLFEVEIDVSKITIDATYIGFVLVFLVILIFMTYLQDWYDWSPEPMPAPEKRLLRIGWPQHESQLEAHKAMQKHRINVALFLLIDILPASFSALVATFFLWHFITGR